LIDATCETIAAIRVSEQGQEGLQAFLERRKPQWIKN
jgi:methylglutaconyl-CoA hydratase